MIRKQGTTRLLPRYLVPLAGHAVQWANRDYSALIGRRYPLDDGMVLSKYWSMALVRRCAEGNVKAAEGML